MTCLAGRKYFSEVEDDRRVDFSKVRFNKFVFDSTGLSPHSFILVTVKSNLFTFFLFFRIHV